MSETGAWWVFFFLIFTTMLSVFNIILMIRVIGYFEEKCKKIKDKCEKK